MARKKVIVKRLNSIQNLARWTCYAGQDRHVTMDRVGAGTALRRGTGRRRRCLDAGLPHSHFQTGLRNVLDRAVLAHKEEIHDQFHVPEHRKLDEIGSTSPAG